MRIEKKLTDKISWNGDASDLLDIILKRVRDQVAEEAKMACYRNNESEVSCAAVLNVLNGIMKPISYFIDAEDYKYAEGGSIFDRDDEK
jgi:hypothetical protein